MVQSHLCAVGGGVIIEWNLEPVLSIFFMKDLVQIL